MISFSLSLMHAKIVISVNAILILPKVHNLVDITSWKFSSLFSHAKIALEKLES